MYYVIMSCDGSDCITGGVDSQNNHHASFQQLESGNLHHTDLLVYVIGGNGTNLQKEIAV